MPRIALPLAQPQATGGTFDSFDPRSAGQARAYWLGTPPQEILASAYTERLAGHEMLLHVVTKVAPSEPTRVSWIVDAKSEFARAFAGGPEPRVSAADGIRAVMLAEAAAESIRTGVAIDVDLAAAAAVESVSVNA